MANMKAIVVREYGGPEVLKLDDFEMPSPGPGEALVRIHAAGVNFSDTMRRRGLMRAPPVPHVPGGEAAGVVEAIGSGVSGLRPGDRVASCNFKGAYAQFAAGNASEMVPIPASLSFAQAAAALLQGMTAHYLTHDVYAVKAGDAALVHSAAGGVGLLLVQMAKMRGARVIGMVSTADKARLAREAGADETILYSQGDFAAEVKRLSGGKGVNVVYDAVGATTFEGSLASLRPRGMLALFGQASGLPPPFESSRLLAMGSLFMTRAGLPAYIATREELLRRASEVYGWAVDGRLKLRIGGSYALADAAKAHDAMEKRLSTGKLVLTAA
jgi:NADPH2:quinone reductase